MRTPASFRMTAPVSEDVNQTLKESTMNQQEKAERFTELMTRFTSVLGKILPDDVATDRKSVV